ncbi:MAG: hypothetical protein ACXVPQ_12875, partial [Bacteroidia bacterium]
MFYRQLKYSAFLLATLLFCRSQAQLLTRMGDYHNQVFAGPAYTQSFGNISYGFNHWRYFKIIKREVVGILDFSSPVSAKYYTRFVFRKGFQLDVYKKKDLKFPIAIVTSSVRKHLHLFNLHDIITDFYFLPGIYHKKYTLAGEFNLKVLWRQKALYNADYYQQADVTPPPNANANRINVSIGVVLAYNLKRFTFLFRG